MINEFDRPAMIRPAPGDFDDVQVLTQELLEHIEHAETNAWNSLVRYKRAGKTLQTIRSKCGHGRWGKWLQSCFPYSDDTARNWMRLAEGWQHIRTYNQGKANSESIRFLADALALLDSLKPKSETKSGQPKSKPNIRKDSDNPPKDKPVNKRQARREAIAKKLAPLIQRRDEYKHKHQLSEAAQDYISLLEDWDTIVRELLEILS